MSISQLYPAEGPTLNLNFAGSRTLDPRITFTRTQTTSNGSTYTGRDGLIKYAGPDEPRFDHRYVNGEIESLGLLIEEQRTNSISNNTMVGALVGTSGTPPTSWGIGTNNAELTHSIVGVGVESGIFYIDVRVSGTVTASRACDIQQAPDITASNGQTWTHSVYLRQVGGSQTNITDIRIQGNVYSSTAYITTPWFHAVPVTTESLITQRRVFTATLVGETITRVRPFIKITTASSGVVDFTLRIGMPQLELGAFATSVIPTEGSTKTRTADNASITGSNFIQIYNQEAGSYKVEGIINSTLPANNFGGVFGAGGGSSTSNFIFLNPSNSFGQYVSNTGQSPASFLGKTYTNGVKFKIGGVYSTNDFACSLNGDISTSTTNNALYKSHTYFRIGGNPISGITGGVLGTMVISNISYYPTRLTNTQLQTLTK
jgi:hypothetical protein